LEGLKVSSVIEEEDDSPARMYQYSRAIYRSIKDLIDPYVDVEKQLEYRRDVLAACEDCVERLTKDPRYFANPDKTLFQDIRRYFPITQQAQVAWAVTEGIGAAVEFIEAQIEAGAFDGGLARCRATLDDRLGEVVAAIVRPSGQAVDKEQLVEHLRPLLAPFKIPTRWFITGEWPVTPTGKVRKFELRDAVMRGAVDEL